MSDCTTGDVFDPAGNGVGSPGGPAPAGGVPEFTHTPRDLSGYRCGAETAVIRLHAGQRATLRLRLKDYNGQPVTGLESSSAFPGTVELRVAHRAGGTPVLVLPLSFMSDDPPVVEGLLDGELTAPGLYQSHVVVLDLDGYLVFAMPVWVEVMPVAGHGCSGPPTISELRLFLRDACPDANLSRTFEYTDDEIAFSIAKPVDEFNANGVPSTRYTVANFPRAYRSYWMEAAASELMRIASRAYMRNHLEYAGAGVTVNDKNKFREYEGAADRLHAKWISFVMQKKREMNFRGGFGGIGSPYAQ